MKKKKLIILILVLFYLGTLIGLYANDSTKYIDKVSSDYIHQHIVIGNITDDTTIGQTFIAKNDNISAISLMFATYNRKNTGKIIFHLKESKISTRDIVTKTVDLKDLRDNYMCDISFSPVKVTKGKTYYFYIESPGATEDNSVTLWYDDLDSPKGVELNVNDVIYYGSLRYIIYYKDHKGLSI